MLLRAVCVCAVVVASFRTPPTAQRGALRRPTPSLKNSPADELSRPSGARLSAVVTAAVLGISSSAVLVRGLAAEAAPLAVAAWRTAGAATVLGTTSASARRGVATMSRRDLALTCAAGALLAAHFELWFMSLGRTSVLRSTVLVSLVPLWVGLADAALGRAAPARFWAGGAAAVVGVAVMAADGGATAVAHAARGGRLACGGDALATGAGLVYVCDARRALAQPLV